MSLKIYFFEESKVVNKSKFDRITLRTKVGPQKAVAIALSVAGKADDIAEPCQAEAASGTMREVSCEEAAREYGANLVTAILLGVGGGRLQPWRQVEPSFRCLPSHFAVGFAKSFVYKSWAAPGAPQL